MSEFIGRAPRSAVIELAYDAAAPSGAAAAAGRSLTTTGQLSAPLAALVELGVIEDLETRSATVEDISRAHPVWRVRLADGRRLVVKAGLGHGGPDLAVECLIYRMTWWCQPLANALPTPMAVDEDRQLLVLADVGGVDGSGSLAQHAGLSSLLGGEGASPPTTVEPGTCRALGYEVGALHRATAGYPLPPASPPLVLAVVGGDDTALSSAQLSERVAATVARLSGHAVITAAVEQLRRPVAGCLVNHDLKWDNVVLDDSASAGEGTPVLLDWELAGLGDPAWDLGCLLAEHLVRSSAPSSAGPCQTTLLDHSARALLGGYRDGARLHASVVPVLAHRVALAAGLRVAQLAVEVAWTPYSGDAGAVDRLIDRTLLVLTAPTLTEEVRRCLA